MTAPSKAVFLSYASEDTVAAARCCQELREAGIEVWFDQSELRGGDDWDHKIRHQIRHCALFLPVISTHTQARAEGYFRLEWKLADQRSQMISRSKPFIVPVCIDKTTERGAEVPESFLQVHWTRLPDGRTTAEFRSRISVLLNGTSNHALQHESGSVPRIANSPIASLSTRVQQPGKRRWTVSIVAIAVTLAAAISWQWSRPSDPSTRTTSTPPTAASATSMVTPAVVAEKSIAVLPFVNMSADRDQEYFADGLSEELIDHLVRNPELKVISRTSSFAFKGRNEDIRTIAHALGVANVLEGSVRKSGDELRITAQLIRASDGQHVWSETYERKVDDIFKVQEEISTKVSAALKTMMSGHVSAPSAAPKSLEAHNLVLRGNFLFYRKNKSDMALAVDLYRQALALDPTYAMGWVVLSRAYGQQADFGWIEPAKAHVLARSAAEKAIEFGPNLPDSHIMLGWLRGMIDWDFAGAREEFQRALALDPSNTKARRSLARFTDTLYGRLEKEIALRRAEIARNPLDTDQIENLAGLLAASGNLQESEATFRTLLQLSPDLAGGHAGLAGTLLMMGRTDDALLEAARETDEPSRELLLSVIYWAQQRRQESDATLKGLEQKFGSLIPYGIAVSYAYRGDADNAFRWLERARESRDGGAVWIRSDPLFARLRDDRRYLAFLREMNLAESSEAPLRQ